MQPVDRRTLVALYGIPHSIRRSHRYPSRHETDETVPDISEINNISLSVARDGVFGNPYAAKTGPTAHSSPVYRLQGRNLSTIGQRRDCVTACNC